MMRLSPLSRSHRCIGKRESLAWACLCVAGMLGGEPAWAEESSQGKAARLGFTFDPRAREAALAAKAKATGPGGLVDEAAPAGVVRLPRYVVTEQLLRLQPDELLTPDGRLKTAKKRYLNPAYQKTIAQVEAVASFLNNPLGGWAPNNPEAMALYEDDRQKLRKGEMAELNELTALHENLTTAQPAKRPKKK